MNVRSSTKPPRPLSTLSKTSPLVKPHASPRVRLASEGVSKVRASPKPKAPLSSPSPSSSSRSSPHLGASSSSASARAVSSTLSPTLSEEQDVVPHTTDSMSLLLGLVTSPNVTTTASGNTFSNSNPATPTFTLGSSRLRRKSSPHASRARAAAEQLSSPRSDAHSYPSSPLLGTLDHREGLGAMEQRAARAARAGVSPRSAYAFASPTPSTSASPSLLPAGLSRDLSALLASPKPHELQHPKVASRGPSLKIRERAEAWPSKEEDGFSMRNYSDLAISQQEAMREPEAFMHFYQPTHKELAKSHDSDAYGRNTLTLSARIKAGMDRYLKGTFDPQSNMILGRGEFSEDLTQDIVTALAFSHDFSAVAIAYMHLYLEEWKDASRKVGRLPVPLVRTLPFGRPYIFQGIQLLVCERDGEYVVEAALSPQWEDFEDRISDFRIWIKVVLEEPDHFKPQDAALYPIKNFVLGRSQGATLHDIWQTCLSFSVWIRELDDLAMMEENSISGSEAEDLYGQWNRRGSEKMDYPRKYMNRAAYARPDPYASYGSDDGGISKRSLGSNKTIVKHFNAVRAEKAERAEPSRTSSLPPKSSSSRLQRKDPKSEPRMHFQDGNLSDASNSSNTPVFQPVTAQMVGPHPELDQARLAPMVMRPKPSFTADLESHHNVHQKRSPLNPVPTVVTSIPRVGSPSDSDSGRRWGYQWRQGSEFGNHPAHNAHANNTSTPYSNVRPPNSAERPPRSYSSYPGHFYQS